MIFLLVAQLLMLHYVCQCSGERQFSELEVRSVFLNCDLEDLATPDCALARFQREELLKHNALRNCKKKLAVTVKMCNMPSVTTGDEFIPIEHVLGAHNRPIRLLNPYILRLRRESPSQLYKIQKLDIVTGTFSTNLKRNSRDHYIYKKYTEEKQTTKYDSERDNGSIYKTKTENAFADDFQMPYYENTERQSSMYDHRLYHATEGGNENVIMRNNLTLELPKYNQYVLYEIGNADLWYKAQIELYEKKSQDAKTMWNDLTKRETASVSTIEPTWENQDMSVRFRTKDVVKMKDFDLPSGSLCLVLPLNYAKENILPKDISINNNGEFVVVPISDIIVVKSKQKGANDELNPTDKGRIQRHVVIETKRSLMAGKMADLNIMEHVDERYLKLPLKTAHCTQIDLEAKADENKLIIPGVVPRDCAPRLSEVIEEPTVNIQKSLIPPMHTNIFIMELPLELSRDDYRCSIALLNGDGVTVATRDVAIKQNDRCFCVWHCNCVCLGDDPKLICRDLPELEIVAAGFSPHEGRRRVRSACYPDVVTINIFVISVGVVFLLLTFGLLKACVGIFLPCAGLMGLECVLSVPRRLDQYYESSLKGRPVVYDKEGWPVHPDTKKRTVQLVSNGIATHNIFYYRPMEFILNVTMFITLPCIMFWDAVMQLVHKCKADHKTRGPFQNTKKCFSSQDTQNVEPRWRRRKGDVRKWMTPQAEALSADIWQYGLSPTGARDCDCRQSLLSESSRAKEKQQALHDSEQDDTAYVLSEMQKSKESLRK